MPPTLQNLVKIGPWGSLNSGEAWRAELYDLNSLGNWGITYSFQAGEHIDKVCDPVYDPDFDKKTNKEHHPERSGPTVGDPLKFTVDYNDYIREIEVTTNSSKSCISSLKFKTNNGNSSPIIGTETAFKFVLPVDKGNLVGFTGNGTDPINSIYFEFAP